ncbi:hypothetical protein IT774_04775 [Salinimonas marina]|uniref:Uncharacterized protein n=1 Tax=Salinimonas marina TaxID=2785918 RepID=A0A7S9DYU2_9ALTE|nr:hypothetical protein [Salinimonas marina]QPG06491.1 hypothetical protein IT774_04775 [Salinimonas marina]
MYFRKFASSIALLCCLIPAAFAADRGYYNPQDIDEIEVTESERPANWAASLNKGTVLDYELFQQGQVVYRDVTQGMVALRLNDKVIRVVEDTREIVDVLNTL